MLRAHYVGTRLEQAQGVLARVVEPCPQARVQVKVVVVCQG